MSSFNVSQIPKNIAYDLIGAIPSVTSARRRFTESVLHLLQYELNSKFFGPKSERTNNAMHAWLQPTKLLCKTTMLHLLICRRYCQTENSWQFTMRAAYQTAPRTRTAPAFWASRPVALMSQHSKTCTWITTSPSLLWRDYTSYALNQVHNLADNTSGGRGSTAGSEVEWCVCEYWLGKAPYLSRFGRPLHSHCAFSQKCSSVSLDSAVPKFNQMPCVYLFVWRTGDVVEVIIQNNMANAFNGDYRCIHVSCKPSLHPSGHSMLTSTSHAV